MTRADLPNLGPPAIGRNNHTANALNRLGHKGSNRLRPLALNDFFELLRAVVFAIGIRAGHMDDAGQAGIDLIIKKRNTG